MKTTPVHRDAFAQQMWQACPTQQGPSTSCRTLLQQAKLYEIDSYRLITWLITWLSQGSCLLEYRREQKNRRSGKIPIFTTGTPRVVAYAPGVLYFLPDTEVREPVEADRLPVHTLAPQPPLPNTQQEFGRHQKHWSGKSRSRRHPERLRRQCSARCITGTPCGGLAAPLASSPLGG